jgi:hypothetical protein
MPFLCPPKFALQKKIGHIIDYYIDSQDKCVSFLIGEFTELKDMESLYQDIKTFSMDIIAMLESASRNDTLGGYFKEDIAERHKELNDKNKKLQENTVNLCFVGTYSSGKSKLINAILGYGILPEAKKPETAKMFRITHCDDQANSSISFIIATKGKKECTKLKWDETSKTFCFYTNIQENKIKRIIQECINENKHELFHIQLRHILSEINKLPNFPPLDNSKNNETVPKLQSPNSEPGGSEERKLFNVSPEAGEKKKTLKKALEEQTNSILIFVISPDRTDGAGITMLIQLLNDIEKNSSKTTIDVERSLFVINKADDIEDEEFGEFEELKLEAKPKEEQMGKNENNKKEMPLKDKRVFFLSAKAAYVARARINKISNQSNEIKQKELEFKMMCSPDAGFYKHSYMALSDYNTKQMLLESGQAVKKAGNNVDEIFIVNSGLYALESEIRKYGNKCAVAVKARSIIDAVQYIIKYFNKKTNAIEKSIQKNKNELENEINTLRIGLRSKIKETEQNFKNTEGLGDKGDIPDEKLISLSLSDRVKYSILRKLDEEFEGIWCIGFTGNKMKKTSEEALRKIDKEFKEYYDDYNNQCNHVVDDKIKFLNNSIIEIIKNCNIDDEAKELLLSLPEIKAGEAPNISSRVNIHKHTTREWYTLGLLVLNKDSLKDDAAKKFATEFDRARDESESTHKKRLAEKCDEIAKSYLSNIDNYSRDLKRRS